MNYDKTFAEIDTLLYEISVSKDDVFRMAQARQALLRLRNELRDRASDSEG